MAVVVKKYKDRSVCPKTKENSLFLPIKESCMSTVERLFMGNTWVDNTRM